MAGSFEPAPGSDVGPAALHRLRIVRLGAFLCQGSPALRIAGVNSGSVTSDAHGIPLDRLTAACDAFNAIIAGDVDAEDMAAARRRRNKVADAIGDRVREIVLEAGL